MIVGSIDVIVQAARLRDGSRRITHITEVIGTEGDVIITQDLVHLRNRGRGRDRQDQGPPHRHRHRAPGFWERARYYGLERELAEALDALQSKARCNDHPVLRDCWRIAGAWAASAFAFAGGDEPLAEARQRRRQAAGAGAQRRQGASRMPAQKRKNVATLLKEVEKQAGASQEEQARPCAAGWSRPGFIECQPAQLSGSSAARCGAVRRWFAC